MAYDRASYMAMLGDVSAYVVTDLTSDQKAKVCCTIASTVDSTAFSDGSETEAHTANRLIIAVSLAIFVDIITVTMTTSSAPTTSGPASTKITACSKSPKKCAFNPKATTVRTMAYTMTVAVTITKITDPRKRFKARLSACRRALLCDEPGQDVHCKVGHIGGLWTCEVKLSQVISKKKKKTKTIEQEYHKSNR